MPSDLTLTLSAILTRNLSPEDKLRSVEMLFKSDAHYDAIGVQEFRIDVNYSPNKEYKKYPISIAAMQGDFKMVDFLESKDADLFPALYVMAATNKIENRFMIQHLLLRGADESADREQLASGKKISLVQWCRDYNCRTHYALLQSRCSLRLAGKHFQNGDPVKTMAQFVEAYSQDKEFVLQFLIYFVKQINLTHDESSASYLKYILELFLQCCDAKNRIKSDTEMLAKFKNEFIPVMSAYTPAAKDSEGPKLFASREEMAQFFVEHLADPSIKMNIAPPGDLEFKKENPPATAMVIALRNTGGSPLHTAQSSSVADQAETSLKNNLSA